MKRTALFSLAILLIFSMFSVPAFAEEAASGQVEVKLKVGDENIVINGEKTTIKKPFISGESTLVPLRVITTAFGAVLAWDADTQGITLKNGTQTIELHIGSKKALINGKETTIDAAPQMVDGTTMVPLRVITENFGAKLKYDSKTREIIITGSKSATADTGGSSAINSDAGKTKIGDSHFDWSMNYPSGLIKTDQSFNGDFTKFSDAKDKYSIMVYVEENESGLENEDLLDELTDYMNGTIVDKQFVRSATQPYAKIVEKNSDSSYTETRLYLKNDKLYFYSFTVHTEADYKNATLKKLYQDLMDSFRIGFDRSDKTLKDISLIQNGYISFTSDDYALKMQLPSAWRMFDIERGIYFYEPETNNILAFSMSSVKESDPIENWVEREENRFKRSHLEQFRELDPVSDVRVAGVIGKARYMAYSYGSTNWYQDYDVFFYIGEYRFNFTFSYDKEDRAEMTRMITKILGSISIDGKKLADTFGYVEDDYDTETVTLRTVKNKDYGYTVKVPRSWSEGEESEEPEIMQFNLNGGFFMVTARETTVQLNDFVQALENGFTQARQTNSDIQLVDSSWTTVQGMTAKKFVFTNKGEGGDPYKTTSYIFKKDNIMFIIDINLYDGTRTPENEKLMEDALNSFTFN